VRIFAVAAFAVAMWIGWAAGGDRQPAAQQVAVARAQPADWRQPHQNPGTTVIMRGMQGHFFVDGDIAGNPVRFIVDTGASAVALSREDARRVGIDPASLTYDRTANTASGTTRYAPVTFPSLRVGDIQLLGVQGFVIDVDETMPLLGQSFLGRIDKVAIESDRMTLTKL
jgi:aspartyl protease family protein